MNRSSSYLKSFSKVFLGSFKLVSINQSSLKDKKLVAFRGYQMFFYCLYLFLFVFVGGFLLTAYGPLNNLLPDFNNNKKRELIDLIVKIDSLESRLLLNAQYVGVINRLFSGEMIDSFLPLIENDTNYNFSSLDLSPCKEDSVLRKIVNEDDRHNISTDYKQKNSILEDFVFFNPVEGLVINNFNLAEKHYGIDVAAHSGASVKSCLDGVVVFADWSVSNGNTIIIQHSENIISLYMHNESLTKTNNDFVRAGEVIGFVGNSGESSSGPHLHFELWQRGVPINPVEYIGF